MVDAPVYITDVEEKQYWSQHCPLWDTTDDRGQAGQPPLHSHSLLLLSWVQEGSKPYSHLAWDLGISELVKHDTSLNFVISFGEI